MIKERIFDFLIKDYLKRANPIGSKYLHKKYLSYIPTSTIRWYLRNLTKEGLLINLKSGKGRIPTDKGWRFYFEKKKNKIDKENYSKEIGKYNSVEEKFNYLLSKFNLYSIICYNSNKYIEIGLDYIIRNSEFDDKKSIIKLAYLIRKIKSNNFIFDYPKKEVILLIGREIKIGFDDFSLFSWSFKKNKYFLLSPKRLNYPVIYHIIKKMFLNH
ncbi:MAG: hypothetical protein NZ866_01395 [Patescibacteria group bacterium]|nr:hypothetical protein [Patescibacteria group bacterium]